MISIATQQPQEKKSLRNSKHHLLLKKNAAMEAGNIALAEQLEVKIVGMETQMKGVGCSARHMMRRMEMKQRTMHSDVKETKEGVQGIAALMMGKRPRQPGESTTDRRVMLRAQKALIHNENEQMKLEDAATKDQKAT